MKAIVFGGSGFLGSHVADALVDAGYKVTVYDKKPSLYLDKKKQNMVIGDVLDVEKVSRAMKDCPVVYNFSGIADMDEAKVSPLDTVKNNILGNAIILEEAVKNKIKRFVFASTVYVYSQKGSFYRSSKQACELLIDNYGEMFGLPYTILRFGSLYGPRSKENNWICRILKEALEKGKISRFGDGEELREYIHVKDAARISVEILAKDYINENVIISGQQAIKIKDLLVMIKEMLGNKIKIEYKKPESKKCPYDHSLHYEITPYSFSPKIGKKLIGRHYLDMGQGILEMLREISAISNKKAYTRV